MSNTTEARARQAPLPKVTTDRPLVLVGSRFFAKHDQPGLGCISIVERVISNAEPPREVQLSVVEPSLGILKDHAILLYPKHLLGTEEGKLLKWILRGCCKHCWEIRMGSPALRNVVRSWISSKYPSLDMRVYCVNTLRFRFLEGGYWDCDNYGLPLFEKPPAVGYNSYFSRVSVGRSAPSTKKQQVLQAKRPSKAKLIEQPVKKKRNEKSALHNKSTAFSLGDFVPPLVPTFVRKGPKPRPPRTATPAT